MEPRFEQEEHISAEQQAQRNLKASIKLAIVAHAANGKDITLEWAIANEKRIDELLDDPEYYSLFAEESTRDEAIRKIMAKINN